MSLELLKSVFDRAGITRIALLDDVFNVPDPAGLDRGRYSTFRRDYHGRDGLMRAIAESNTIEPYELPTIDNLDEDQLIPLWHTMWRHQLGYASLPTSHAASLTALFSDHHDDVLGMLDTVKPLCSLFRDQLRRTLCVYGTDYDPVDVAGSQIVAIDYFLGLHYSQEEALEAAVDVVSKIVRETDRMNSQKPSFLLVSSRPQEINIDLFRRRCDLMKSRFRFFDKEDLHGDRIDNMVRLYELVDASDRTAKTERLIDDWQMATKAAIHDVRERMLSLDVSDLVYLDFFRLTHEGTSIGNYLRWFLTSLLASTVARRLTGTVWREAEQLAFFGVVDHHDSGLKSLPTSYYGPSEAVAHAYGDILFDESRGTGSAVFPASLPPSDLVEGDLFVRPSGTNGTDLDGAEVRLVLTPSCDLRPRAPDEPPSADRVLLVPGKLRVVKHEEKDTNFAESDYVRVQAEDGWRLLQIKWEFNRPVSYKWSHMARSGPGVGFVRLGRIRELYFHKIRERYFNRNSRIGTEIGPLFPHAKGGKVLIRVDGRRRVCVMAFSSEDRFMWEIGPVRMKGKRKDVYVYQGSQAFIDKLLAELRRAAVEQPQLMGHVQRCEGFLNDMHTYMDIGRPMVQGARGADRNVELKAVSRSADPPRSSADLLVLVFVE